MDLLENSPLSDVDHWAARNQYWLTRKPPKQRYQARRERRIEPLVLCGDGVIMAIERGTLLIRNGLTYYPQERTEFRFFRGDLNLPTRIIMVDGSGTLSFDVLSWLSEQGVSLIILDWQGDAVSVLAGTGSAFLSHAIEWQQATRNDPVARIEFSVELIRIKLENSIVTLRSALPPHQLRENAITKARIALDRLESRRLQSIREVMLVLGEIGRRRLFCGRPHRGGAKASLGHSCSPSRRPIRSKS